MKIKGIIVITVSVVLVAALVFGGIYMFLFDKHPSEKKTNISALESSSVYLYSSDSVSSETVSEEASSINSSKESVSSKGNTPSAKNESSKPHSANSSVSHRPSDGTDGTESSEDIQTEYEQQSSSSSKPKPKPPAVMQNNKPAEEITLEGKKYKMTFFDGFDGTKLDMTKWSYCPEWNRQDVGGRWNNTYTKVDGRGNLVVDARLDAAGKPIATAIRTAGTFGQARGYFEIRCKLQQAPGFWAAFWMMCGGVGSVGNGAKDGVEIDIFESHNVEQAAINQGIHWDGYGAEHKQAGRNQYYTNCYDGKYHTFACLWTDKGYIFYIDGQETYRLMEGDEKFPGSCAEEGYLKITIEFGTWAGKIDKETLPDNILVDYVAAYQLK